MAKEQKNTQKQFKLNAPMLLISIILFIITFIIKNGLAIRPILWIISIILLIINVTINNKFKKTTIIFLLVLSFLISIALDGIISITFKRIPVFSYNIISTNNSRVYNGIGIRVWQCDKNNYDNLIVDPFYNKGYLCDAKDIDVVDSNSFLNSVVENYNDYKNSYVKIKGKISKKTGQNYIEMRPYETTNITVNGYVTFADNITLRIIFKNSEEVLDNYDVYDEITIVGIIKNLENNSNKYIIYMYDSKVVSDINLNEYTISATQEQKCSIEPNILYSSDTNNIYSYCLEEIIVSYGENNKYELSNALSSNKIKIEDLYKNPKEIINNEDNENKIYRFDNYSVLVCDKNTSKDIIIGNKKMSFKDVSCQTKIEE